MNDKYAFQFGTRDVDVGGDDVSHDGNLTKAQLTPAMCIPIMHDNNFV